LLKCQRNERAFAAMLDDVAHLFGCSSQHQRNAASDPCHTLGGEGRCSRSTLDAVRQLGRLGGQKRRPPNSMRPHQFETGHAGRRAQSSLSPVLDARHHSPPGMQLAHLAVNFNAQICTAALPNASPQSSTAPGPVASPGVTGYDRRGDDDGARPCRRACTT
jgi:hypothetical protein